MSALCFLLSAVWWGAHEGKAATRDVDEAFLGRVFGGRAAAGKAWVLPHKPVDPSAAGPSVPVPEAAVPGLSDQECRTLQRLFVSNTGQFTGFINQLLGGDKVWGSRAKDLAPPASQQDTMPSSQHNNAPSGGQASTSPTDSPAKAKRRPEHQFLRLSLPDGGSWSDNIEAGDILVAAMEGMSPLVLAFAATFR